jgi:deoxyadenosine/deoxycytidine kinase
MNLIFLFGLPGVGKLTVARELSNLTKFKVFHNHLTVDLVTSLFEFGSESFINLREKIWLETFAEAIRANFEGLIFTFAPEKTVPEDFPEKVKNLFAENGGKVIFVELKCSVEELEKRLADSSRAKFGKLNSVDFFRELNSQGVFNNPKITADFAVDTTNLSPSETANIIAKKLNLA